MSNLNDKHPSKMTDEECRRAIAEVVAKENGWTVRDVPAAGEGIFAFINSDGQLEGFPLNYPSDVEAAMGLQDSVPERLRPAFMVHLFDIIYGAPRETYITDTYWAVVHATARQRCEAFILTMRQK